jgi:hypothetical protein
VSEHFAGHPGYPGKWYDNGPFGMWDHPDGYSIVGTNPGYVLSKDNKTLGEFDDLYTAMLSIEKSMNKIYAFSAIVGGREGIAYAIAEDGTVLGSHWCSDEYFVSGDLGVDPGSRPDRHKTYAEHYPSGYEMEFVPAKNVKKHAGLKEACV